MNEYKMPAREQNSNKGTFGKVLNFAGSKNYIGAAYLSTISPLKVGAGFVALSSEKEIIRSVSALLPEAVYLSHKDGLRNLEQYSVVLIGCGLGNNEKLFKDVIKKLRNKNIPVVIDADGLNILAKLMLQKDKEILRFAQNDEKVGKPFNKADFFTPQNDERANIITPHPLEASRLLGVSLKDILDDLEGSAKALSKKYNCVCVLKTHRTIICQGDEIFVNQHGNSALAKAGSGDVLAGIIAGLLAQKVEPFDAAKLGVYLHSRAGEIASEDLTEYSVLASDLPNYLPQAIKEIL